MDAGIIGIAFVGKTTLFNALTEQGVASGTGSAVDKPNIGVVNVPDRRLDVLNKHIKTKRTVPATMQLVDIAGLVAGASKGEGLGNKFLSHIRNADALLHVVRCFEDPNVPHVDGSVDPIRDIESVETEMLLADLEQVEGMLDKAQRQTRGGDKQAVLRAKVLERCHELLGEGKPVSSLSDQIMDQPDAKTILKGVALLTAKPVLYIANVGEDDLRGQSEGAEAVQHYARSHDAMAVCVCAKLDAELVELAQAERQEMLEALGLAEPALAVLARAAYERLGLQSFFTAGPKENRAWTIPIGATAPQAAGVVHTDMQRGFIRNEVYSIEDLDEYESEQALRAAGKLRVEGKSYVMQDGDVCHFLFNV